MSQQTERVHTMTDFYDGPRAGVADYHGRPHLYESLWHEANQRWADAFALMPISTEDRDLAVERYKIYERWETARRKGLADLDTHPALPPERARFDELERIIAPRLRMDLTRALTALGVFDYRTSFIDDGTTILEQFVTWTPCTVAIAGLVPASTILRDAD